MAKASGEGCRVKASRAKVSVRGQALEGLRRQGWTGLAALILYQAYHDGDIAFFGTPWARLLAAGVGMDLEYVANRLEARQSKCQN